MGAVSPPLPPQGDLRSLLPAHRALGRWGQLRKVVPGLNPQSPPPLPREGPSHEHPDPSELHSAPWSSGSSPAQPV